MIAPEYFNNHIAVEGEIVVKRVPNDTGSVLVWNSTTKKISTRTVSEIVSDLNVLTTNTNQLITGQKYFVTRGGNHAPTNNALQIYADDGSLPSMTYSKGGSYVGQVMFDEGGFHFKNGDNNNHYGITAGGFKKDGYNNDFALLAGGGQLTLSELSKTNHIHNSLENINFFQSSDLNNELEAGKFKFRPAVMSNSPNIFPNPHNANAILSISTWSDAVYGHDLGFSGDGNIYHRSRDTGGIYQWNKILTEGNANLPNFSNFVTTNTPQDIPVKKSFSGSTGNAYDSVALELKGNGTSDTIYPAISFHQPGLYAATLQYRANGYHFMNINGNAFDYVRAAGYFKDGSSDDYFLTGDGGHYSKYGKDDAWVHSGRNFTDGTLISTDIDYSQISGAPFLLEIKGNMYGTGVLPLDAKIQGYIWDNTIINQSGYSTNPVFKGVVALNLNGKLCFWFPSLGYWHGFSVKVSDVGGGQLSTVNHVTNIENVGDPGGTKRVDIYLNHLLTKEELISGNTFWEKKDIGGYWALDSDKPIAGLNGNGAQVILSGGLLASSSYTDSQFIPDNGIHSRGFVQSDEGFQNRYWKADQRNRIWSFANSDGHGLSYFQGSGHVLGEGINFHFGDASSTGYKAFVQNSGRIFSALDGNSGDWKHKEYNANNYLGADYVGGGQEKPNSIYFGAGKLKLQMLEASQMGTSNFGWSDVLWMSSYAGGDVKKSTAIVSSKYSDRIGFVKQDYDAADWGTFQEFWTTSNLTNPASQADLDNYYHINKGGGISNQSELVPNGLQSISIGNSGSNFDGELANKTIEGTFASFNGYSKTSKDLGFTLFSPTSTGQGVYYKTWYGGNQTPWKRLAEHSDLSGYVKSLENAYSVGFSSGLSTEAPYMYHSTDGYVFLATQKWVTSNFPSYSFLAQYYALRTGSNATDTWVNAAYGLINNPYIPGKIKDGSGNDSDLINATHGSVMGMINTSGTANGNPNNQWFHRIKMLHNNPSGYNTEIAVQMTGGNSMWYKRYENGTYYDWVQVWDKESLPDYRLYGLGTINPVSATDLNNVSHTSILDINDSTIKKPFGYGSVWTHRKGSVEYTQMAVEIFTGDIWSRAYSSAAGSTPWVRSWNTSHFTSTNIANWNIAYNWGNHANAGYSTQTWVSQNYMPTAHVANTITSTNILQWNDIYNYGLRLNQQFTINTGNEIAIVDGYNGGESGLYDKSYDKMIAGKEGGEYYKYGSNYNNYNGLNFHLGANLFGVGKEMTNDEDKVQIAGNISVDTVNISDVPTELVLNPLYNTNGDVRRSRNAHIYIVTGNSVRLPDKPILGQRIEIFNDSDSDIEVTHGNVGTMFYVPRFYKTTGIVGARGFIFDEKPVPAKKYDV